MRFILPLVLTLSISSLFSDQARSDETDSTRSAAMSAAGQWPTLQPGNDQAGPTAGQKTPESVSRNWKRETIDTTADADYLTESERQVIIEINMVRTDPAAYALSYLAPLRSFYHDKILQFPGEIAILTNEGVRALDESVRWLQSAQPQPPLSPQKGLVLAARDHARDQAMTGAEGHTGRDGSTMEARLNRYGRFGISAGENIGYGNKDARRIVTALLIDDGVPSRGHRKNLLNGTFRMVGVSVGPHPVYGHMCVMEFAGSYR